MFAIVYFVNVALKHIILIVIVIIRNIKGITALAVTLVVMPTTLGAPTATVVPALTTTVTTNDMPPVFEVVVVELLDAMVFVSVEVVDHFHHHVSRRML